MKQKNYKLFAAQKFVSFFYISRDARVPHVLKKLLNTHNSTPSVLNYKSFQKIWRVKPSQSLTKIIERNTKIYDIK